MTGKSGPFDKFHLRESIGLSPITITSWFSKIMFSLYAWFLLALFLWLYLFGIITSNYASEYVKGTKTVMTKLRKHIFKEKEQKKGGALQI